MKILMRADTHVSFSVPAEDPVAKCTVSQVNQTRWFHYYYIYIFFLNTHIYDRICVFLAIHFDLK